jgi:hypothetical protein
LTVRSDCTQCVADAQYGKAVPIFLHLTKDEHAECVAPVHIVGSETVERDSQACLMGGTELAGATAGADGQQEPQRHELSSHQQYAETGEHDQRLGLPGFELGFAFRSWGLGSAGVERDQGAGLVEFLA